jgi:hypothetical protein
LSRIVPRRCSRRAAAGRGRTRRTSRHASRYQGSNVMAVARALRSRADSNRESAAAVAGCRDSDATLRACSDQDAYTWHPSMEACPADIDRRAHLAPACSQRVGAIPFSARRVAGPSPAPPASVRRPRSRRRSIGARNHPTIVPF